MKLIISISISLIFILTGVKAQENYQPAEIIYKTGKSQSGLINYKNWDRNPKKLQFKEFSDSEVQLLSPLEIAQINVSEDVYIGSIIQKEISPYKTNLLTDEKILRLREDTVFLRVLVNGPKKLLHYKDEGNKEHFYIEIGDEQQLLKQKKYTIIKQGKKYVQEVQTFKGQLTAYFDCKLLNNKIAHVNYTGKQLIGLFESFYKNCGDFDQYKIFKSQKEVNIGILGGLSSSSIQLTHLQNPTYALSEFDNSLDPTLGVFMEFIIPRSQKKWSFNTDLIYTTYDLKGTYERYINPDEYRYIETRVNYSYLKSHLQLRYNQKLHNTTLFVNAGIGMTLGFFGAFDNRLVRQKFYGPEEVLNEDVFISVRGERSLIAGIGIAKNKLSGQIRYESSNGPSSNRLISSPVSRILLMVGYRLKNKKSR